MIDYDKDGDIVVKDKDGKIIGHISTMGNMIEETDEDRERQKKAIERAHKILGIKD